MKNTIKAALAVLMIIYLIAVVLPATASKPAWNGSYYPDVIDGNQTSAITMQAVNHQSCEDRAKGGKVPCNGRRL